MWSCYDSYWTDIGSDVWRMSKVKSKVLWEVLKGPGEPKSSPEVHEAGSLSNDCGKDSAAGDPWKYNTLESFFCKGSSRVKKSGQVQIES